MSNIKSSTFDLTLAFYHFWIIYGVKSIRFRFQKGRKEQIWAHRISASWPGLSPLSDIVSGLKRAQ